MRLDTKNTVKLSELIYWVKKELFEDAAPEVEQAPLFIIEEVTVEVNFVLTGGGEAGLNLHVLKAGTKVGEERVQKAVVRMKPVVPYEKVVARFAEKHPRVVEQVLDDSVRVLLKGRTGGGAKAVPQRQ